MLRLGFLTVGRLMAVAAASDRHGVFLEDFLEMADLLDLACWREVETLPEAEIYWQALEVLVPVGEGKGW